MYECFRYFGYEFDVNLSKWLSGSGQVFGGKGTKIHADNDLFLQCASRNDHLEVVKFLVENGTNIHADNDLALQWACLNDHFQVTKFLVNKGANIHIENDYALQHACLNVHLEVIVFDRKMNQH
jgi:FOG: Ankyrin repeat